MKNTFLSLSVLCLAFSCQTPVFIEPVGPEKELVLQARLLTSDEQHTVYASYSFHDNCEPAEDITVSCYVNGQLVAVTSEDTRLGQYREAAYQFKATIQPGDSVRIEAIGPDNRAVARTKAPEALPAIPDVTAEELTIYNDKGNVVTRFRFHIPVHDIPQERNWYRINTTCHTIVRMYVSEEVHEKEPWYPTGWSTLEENTLAIRHSNTKDPVLNPDGRESKDSYVDDYLSNPHHFFTDELFEDGSNEFILEASPYDYTQGARFSMSSGIQYQYTITAYFDIQSLSREDFMHSRMLEMDHFNLSGVSIVDDLFSEDMVLPGNVEGGMGLVTVRSVTRAPYEFGTYDCDVHNWYDVYDLHLKH
ncbi:MAG TPA: hypothetical protein DCF48_05820 [Rikenellaceae bacterium]|nr:hypothetical protein [Rikenellaceae bacterium]